MAYRTGTYVAFDGQSETNPASSDFKYYATIQAWGASPNIEFKLANSHERTYAVKDTSSNLTLRTRIQERLRLSKNVLVILSSDTRKTGSLLSFEVQEAVDRYSLPLIIAYAGRSEVLDPQLLNYIWPIELAKRIDNRTARAIHIPFKKGPIRDAITRFTVQNGELTRPLHHYDRPTHIELGCFQD